MFGFTGAIHGGVVCGHLPEHPLEKLERIDWVGPSNADRRKKK